MKGQTLIKAKNLPLSEHSIIIVFGLLKKKKDFGQLFRPPVYLYMYINTHTYICIHRNRKKNYKMKCLLFVHCHQMLMNTVIQFTMFKYVGQ